MTAAKQKCWHYECVSCAMGGSLTRPNEAFSSPQRLPCGIFFFYFYGAHRDLHSFPTRRSSDLPAYRAECPPHRACRLPTRVPQSQTSQPDRKSTRLNSSHVAISYAVFCLKK